MTSLRQAPPVFGLGLLEAVSEETILSMADPDDADGDGISGRANTVWAAERGEAVLGRFGHKANNPDLRHQVAGAYAKDMGVSNPVFHAGLADGEPTDLDEETLGLVVFYMQTLGVPARAPYRHRRGASRRAAVPRGRLRELPRAHPGDRDARGRGRGEPDDPSRTRTCSCTTWATASPTGVPTSWRRAASGARRRSGASGSCRRWLPGAGYLHDGRARTLEEAILWHGGEGEASREAYRTASAADRQALLKFLGSL